MKLNEWQLWTIFEDRTVTEHKAYDRATMFKELNLLLDKKGVLQVKLYVPKKVRDRR